MTTEPELFRLKKSYSVVNPRIYVRQVKKIWLNMCLLFLTQLLHVFGHPPSNKITRLQEFVSCYYKSLK